MAGDKITSIAELKKRVDFWANKDKNVMPSEKASLQWVLVLISEFEASVKERLKELESSKTEFRGWVKRTFGDEELRRVLGEDGQNSV